MIKARNVIIGQHIISMECLRNGSEKDVCQVLLDKDTLEFLPESERDAYACKAAAKARQYYKKTGSIPKEFSSVWY